MNIHDLHIQMSATNLIQQTHEIVYTRVFPIHSGIEISEIEDATNTSGLVDPPLIIPPPPLNEGNRRGPNKPLLSAFWDTISDSPDAWKGHCGTNQTTTTSEDTSKVIRERNQHNQNNSDWEICFVQ